MGALRLDLRSCRKGNQGVTERRTMSNACAFTGKKGREAIDATHVKAMERIPPPAPDNACAMLSLC